MHSRFGSSWIVVLALGVLTACDPDPRYDPACPSGTLGCPCLPDETCEENEGQCLEDTCVDAEVDEPLPPQAIEPPQGMDPSRALEGLPQTSPASVDGAAGAAGS